MDNNKIGNVIAELRKKKGLTQQELGDKIYISGKAVSKWERGISLPDIGNLERLAEVLDADVSDILCIKSSKRKDVDIQKELDKAIAKIKEEQEIKDKKIINIIKLIYLGILVVFSILIVRYKYYHPFIIKEGVNNYEIGFFGIYDLEKNGLDEFIEIMKKTENKNFNSNLTGLNIELYKNGNIKEIIFSVDYFDDKYEYVGSGNYEYQNRKLNYTYNSKEDCGTVSECEVNKMLVFEYSKSLNMKYLTDVVKRIPFKRQIKLSELNNYKVSLSFNEKMNEPMSVFDMRDNKDVKTLNLTDYKSGKGGTVTAGIYSVISLSDGSSAIADEMYKYVFDNVDGDVKKTDYTMETDYYINPKNELLFTRDYGNTWIKTDISEDDIFKTLRFYRDISFPNSSWFISNNELVPIAYFYGEEPKLKLSLDNGISWIEKEFDIASSLMYKSVMHRIVGFKNQNFGYVALGTDWTMGSGEIKKAYYTLNSGVDWLPLELPEIGSSKTLDDFIMLDENIGIVLLYNNGNVNFPYMYVTTSGGSYWERVDYAGSIPDAVTYITNIDDLEKNDNIYTIVLSQGDSTTTKVKIESSDLRNWRYVETFNKNIHTVG